MNLSTYTSMSAFRESKEHIFGRRTWALSEIYMNLCREKEKCHMIGP